MKLTFFFIFSVGCIATSGALNPIDVGYRLALGPLEFFLKLNKREVSICYERKDDAYAQSILDFSKKINEIKKRVNTVLTGRSDSRGYLNWGLDEMQNIAESLKDYLVDLKKKIYNSQLVEGGNAVWGQRHKLENHYGQYEKHKTDLRGRRESHYSTYIPQMDNAFQVILYESDKLLKNVLECCEKTVSFIK